MLPSPVYKQPLVSLFLFILFLNIINNTRTLSNTAFAANDNNTDHLALLMIKSEIRDDDPRGVMSSWNESLHFCQWQGVTCGRRHRRVTVLDLSYGGLIGSLSPYIGNLSFLRVIQLSDNKLKGEIPPEVGRLFRLEVLNLANNSFRGEVPANLSHCSNLNRLQLGYNNLVGRIPEELSSLLMLEYLAIHYNVLTGGIPTFIGNLTSLRSLSLASCQLGRRIPDAFHPLRRLRQLGLGGNKLVGTIPSSIYNLSLLEILSLPDNKIHDNLPTNIGSMLPLLQFLNLGRNFITGSLPPSISNCSQISRLDMGANKMTGKIFVDFGSLQNLRILVLQGNNFGRGVDNSMEFIDSLSNCSKLQVLELGNTQLQGVLPNSLVNFSTKLSFLSLGQNYLYGSIPPSIGNLLGLSWLNLVTNQLTGTIPTSISNLHNLQLLFFQENNLSGEIPDTIGNLSSLLELAIGGNKLEGLLPSGIGKCQNLMLLSSYQNSLSGSIPKQLFHIPSLTILLDLRRNNFSGPISPEIGNLKNLNKLDLSRNNLSGELPSTLAGCTSLEFLDLSINMFQGSISTSLGSLRSLQVLNLSSNNFSGQIPSFWEHVPFQYLNLSFNNLEGEVSVKGVFANASALFVVGNDRLCGGIPELQLPKCISTHSNSGRHKLSLALIISMSTLVGAIVVTCLIIYSCIKRRKDQMPRSSLKELFLKLSYERLLKATDGFSSENLIGTGSFSSVYKGVIDEVGLSVVAIKVLNLQRRGGSRSFVAECEALRNIRHRNLLKVITSCSSIDFQGNDFKAIVYEFMPNGSLEGWLNPSTGSINELPKLGFLQRINIAIDVAYAIDYLHHHCGKTIVHCDLKPSNILLDKDMIAHVGDFGLAKLLLPEISNANQSSSSIGVRGTVGYAAPEYGLGSEVSTKGDVYSYGILLLEMLTGKKPTDSVFEGGLTLHNYARTALVNSVLDIMDSALLVDDDE